MNGPIKPQVYAVSVETSSDLLDDSCIAFYEGFQNAYTELVQQQIDRYMTSLWQDTFKPQAPPPPPTRRERLRRWLADKLLALARRVDPDVLDDYYY